MMPLKDGVLQKSEKIDILIINMVSLVLILIIILDPSNIIRPILGFIFVTFFPGYMLSKICFSNYEITSFERICLSFGLSMIIVPSIGLALLYSPLKIKLLPYLLSIYIFIFITTILSIYKYLRQNNINHKTSIEIINIKKLNMILILALITLFGLFVRIYPQLDYSIYSGCWKPGNYLYPTYYTIQTGEILERGAIQGLTRFSSTIHNYLAQKAFILFQAAIFLISGLTDLNKYLLANKLFPWCGALLFPLSVTLIVYKVTSDWKHIILAYFIANFASLKILYVSSLMSHSPIMSFSLMLFTIYFLLLSHNNKNPKIQLLCILFTFFILQYYHSAGVVFLILLTFILFTQRIVKIKVVSENYILLYIIFFITYYMYLANVVFESYIRTLTELIREPGASSTQIVMGRKIVEPTIPHISAYLNILMTAILILVFVFLWIKGEITRDHYSTFIIYLCGGLLVAGCLFFAWRGLKGFGGRMGEYMSIALMLMIPKFMIIKNKKKRKIITISLLIVALTSIIAYMPGTVLPPNYLTHSEASAIEWYSIHRAENGKNVFTDFRIGTGPIMLNCFNFIGFTGHEKELKKLLKDIYYGNNSTNASITLKNYKAEYILLSREMMSYGILTFLDAYKPITQQNLAKYTNSTLFGKIYDNGYAWYFLNQNYE